MNYRDMAKEHARKYLSKWWGNIRASDYQDALKELTASHETVMAHAVALHEEARRVAEGTDGGG